MSTPQERWTCLYANRLPALARAHAPSRMCNIFLFFNTRRYLDIPEDMHGHVIRPTRALLYHFAGCFLVDARRNGLTRRESS